MKNKVCCRCEQEKATMAFYKHKHTKDGVTPYCKQCAKIAFKKYYARTREKRIEVTGEYAKQNAEKISKYQKEYRENNIVQDNERHKLWRKNNPLKVKDSRAKQNHARRAIKNGEIDKDITISMLYERDKEMCGICRELVALEDRSIDHIKPISKGGTHVWNNVQLAHFKCNTKKGNKYDSKTRS
jgi:5-methylcytosine-specific restriction endonuclease McrA